MWEYLFLSNAVCDTIMGHKLSRTNGGKWSINFPKIVVWELFNVGIMPHEMHHGENEMEKTPWGISYILWVRGRGEPLGKQWKS